jgi:hypothetical protein
MTTHQPSNSAACRWNRHPPFSNNRSRRHGGLVVCLVALLTAMAIGAPPQPDGRAALIEQLLAVVNGKTIALSDLRRYQLLFAPDAPPEQALQQLIDHQLLLVEAVRFDTEPPQASRIQEAVQRLEKAAGGRAAWEAALQRVQLTPAGAEELITDELRVETLLSQRVDQFVIVTRTEVEAVYDKQPERYQGKTLAEVEPSIERELVQQKITAKRQEYMNRIRGRATITLLTNAPGKLPTRP